MPTCLEGRRKSRLLLGKMGGHVKPDCIAEDGKPMKSSFDKTILGGMQWW